MQQLATVANRVLARCTYGLVAYWTLNAILVLAEARWHVLYRLTLWDISLLRTLLHPGAS